MITNASFRYDGGLVVPSMPNKRTINMDLYEGLITPRVLFFPSDSRVPPPRSRLSLVPL